MKKKLLYTFATFLILLCLSLTVTTRVLAGKGTALSGDLGNNYHISQSGSYYLSGDASGNLIIDKDVTATLDLNGFTLTGTGGSSVIVIDYTTTTLTLTDSSADGTGMVTGGKNPKVDARQYFGSGVRNSGTFIMTGGTITGNTIEGNYYSSTSCCGAGVYNTGTFIMTGGRISGNSISCTGARCRGGGVYNSATIIVGGTAVIQDNTIGTAANNLYLGSNGFITFGTGTNGAALPAETMKIRVNTLKTPTEGQAIKISTETDQDYHTYFSSDSSNYRIQYNQSGKYLELVLNQYSCELTTGTTTAGYDTIQEALTQAGTSTGTIRLLKDVKENVTLANGQTITLDLNGFVLTGTGNSVINVTDGSSLTLEDSDPTVSHYGDNAALPAGGVITGGASTNGGGVYVTKNAVFTMNGGTVCGNTATNYGGGVYIVGGGTGSATVNGGTISGNSAKQGGGLYTGGGAATVSLLGGTITGNKATEMFGGVLLNANGGKTYTVGGSIRICDNTVGGKDDNLTLWDVTSAPLAVSTQKPLDEGAEIHLSLKKSGTLTYGNVTIAGSSDYHSYFISDSEAYTVINDASGGVNAQVVQLASHVHSWTYALGKTVSDNDTITASCIGFNPTACDYAGSKSLTIQAPTQLTYDGEAKAATLSTANITGTAVSTDNIVYYKGTEKLAGAPTDVGSYTAKLTVELGGKDYTILVNYEIIKATLTVVGTTADGKDYDGDLTATVYAGTLTGKVDGDDVSIGSCTGTFDSASVGNGRSVTVTYTLIGTDAGNYTVTDSTTCADIALRKVTVTADDKTMLLGDTVPDFTAQVKGMIGEDTVVYSFHDLNPEAQGVYSIVPSGEATQGNYAVSYVPGTLSVSKNNKNVDADSNALLKILEQYRENQLYSGKILDVELRTDGQVPEDAKQALNLVIPAGKKQQLIETELYLIVKEEGQEPSEQNIGDENDELIAVTYTFDFSEKKDIQIFRAYQNSNKIYETDELTETPNEAGEFVSVDEAEGIITITAKRYSTFAFAYTEVNNRVNTGDSNRLTLWLTLSVLSLLALAGVTVIRKKKYSRS